MAKRGSKFEPVSTPLEDAIPVSYTVVGTERWFSSAFHADAVSANEKLVVSTRGDLAPVLERLWRSKAIGGDTETTGRVIKGNKNYSMNPVNPDTRFVTMQLGTPDHTFVIDPELFGEFKEILESDKILKIFQNALYDFKWLLRKSGIHLNRLFDTMLAEQVRTAGLMGVRVGLADMARKYDPFYLISKAVRAQFVELGGGRMNREMVYYAARDIPLMFPVFRALLKELKDQKLEAIAKMEFECIPCTAEMELEGVYLKSDKLDQLIEYWQYRQLEMEQRILSEYGKELQKQGIRSMAMIPEVGEVFDLKSGPAKLEALRLLGFKLDDTRRETLLAIDHPVAALLGEYSNVLKWTSTYGDNIREKINPTTGMWHPRFAQMGSGEMEAASGRDSTTTTATGRFVSDAQQFPRKTERYSNCAMIPELAREAMEHFQDQIAALTGMERLLAA